MVDDIESLLASAAADAATSKLAKRHRWVRAIVFSFRLLFWAAMLAAVVVTFAYY
jgi:hypothetical protein